MPISGPDLSTREHRMTMTADADTTAVPLRRDLRMGAPAMEDPLERAADQRVPLALRAFEIAVALGALLVTLPLMIVVAIMIRLDSPGPVLFWQPRIGLGGRPFQFVKFRTMYADARERFPELYRYSYAPQELDQLMFKVPDDPRVTPLGRWLRKTSIDELPNFLNLLTGSVALVGPRPEIPEMMPYYVGEDREIFSVRPGITGPAQVAGRGWLNFRDSCTVNLEYVRTRTWRMDLSILVRTAFQVTLGRGAF
jgi:lipopolysaccharide/colanic/teichoic acid biosynthesis glycosyltransferase